MRKSVLLVASMALTLLFASGAALVGLGDTAHASFPGNNGKIAFVRGGDLYIMDDDGDPQTRLPDGMGGSDPTWSADGTKIAFVKGGDVYTMNANGSGEPTNLTNSPANECLPTWAPNGAKIAYARTGKSSPLSDVYPPCMPSTSASLGDVGYQDIYVKKVDGTGGPVKLTDTDTVSGPPDTEPAWSPDGTMIAFVRKEEYLSCPSCDPVYTTRIYTMNASDGSNQLQRTESRFNSKSPDWSPSGTRIAFSRSKNIYTMDFDGTGLDQLISGGNNSAPVYSPDGTKIAFTSTRISGNSEIYTMGVNGNGLTNRTNNAAEDVTPDWQPDRTPPETDITSAPPAFYDEPSAVFRFTSTGDSVECRIDDGVYGRCDSPKVYRGLPDGPHTFKVRSEFDFGVTDPTPASHTWFVDTARPTGTVTINGGRENTTSRAVTLKLRVSDPAPTSGGIQMRLRNGGGNWTVWQPYATSKPWKLSSGAGGKRVKVQYKDRAGNVSSTEQDYIRYRP